MSALPQISELFGLAGKSALITGATGSLGSIAAKALAAQGAKVTLAGSSLAKLEELVAEIKAAGGEARAIALRPDSEANVAKLIDDTCAAQGGLDILYVASGINKPGGATVQTLDEFDAVLDANVRQTFLVCKAAALKMKELGNGGKIIVTSSVRGLVSTNNSIAYTTSKAATDMLVKSLCNEFGQFGICVNAIAPACSARRSPAGSMRIPSAPTWSARASSPACPSAAWASPRTSPARSCSWRLRPPTTSAATSCTSTAASPSANTCGVANRAFGAIRAASAVVPVLCGCPRSRF